MAQPRSHWLKALGHARGPLPARWPWTVEVAPLLLIPRLDDAPPIEAAGSIAF